MPEFPQRLQRIESTQCKCEHGSNSSARPQCYEAQQGDISVISSFGPLDSLSSLPRFDPFTAATIALIATYVVSPFFKEVIKKLQEEENKKKVADLLWKAIEDLSSQALIQADLEEEKDKNSSDKDKTDKGESGNNGPGKDRSNKELADEYRKLAYLLREIGKNRKNIVNDILVELSRSPRETLENIQKLVGLGIDPSSILLDVLQEKLQKFLSKIDRSYLSHALSLTVEKYLEERK